MLDLEQIKRKFLKAEIVEQIIYINIGLFLITFILGIFKNDFIYEWFSLPSDFKTFTHKPWSIISYGFLHAGFIHILSNLIGLFYFGNLFLEYFTKKQFLNFYLLGTLVGGLFYLFGSGFFVSFENTSIPLVGASAAVSAILIGIATYLPNYQLKFALIGYVKLWHIALFWIGYNLLFITASHNIGGNLAHLGGALFGFIYVQFASNKSLNLIPSFKKKKTKLQTVHRTTNRRKTTEKSANQQEVDAILDKISKSGYDSLSKEEKDFLFRQGNRS